MTHLPATFSRNFFCIAGSIPDGLRPQHVALVKMLDETKTLRVTLLHMRVGIAQSAQRLASVRWSNPGGGEIFRTWPHRPWGPPSLLYNGYRVFPGTKRPRRDADYPYPSSAKVKGRLELSLYSTSGPSYIHTYMLLCNITRARRLNSNCRRLKPGL